MLKISDPNPIFQIAPLPTYPLCHIAYYNDIHNQNLNIHTVNYIHMWFYLCVNIIAECLIAERLSARQLIVTVCAGMERLVTKLFLLMYQVVSYES